MSLLSLLINLMHENIKFFQINFNKIQNKINPSDIISEFLNIGTKGIDDMTHLRSSFERM